MVSLSSMLGCSRFALSTFFVGCLVVLGFLPVGGSFVCGFSLVVGILMVTDLIT